MARARNLKPGFFRNEDLAELGPYAMLLYAGLWLIADREGRLEDRPKRIKADVFPYFPDPPVDELLDALARAGFINRYDGFISIPTWLKHQNPHIKEAASTIPAPDLNSSRTVLAPDEHQTRTVLAPEEPQCSPASSLNPSSLNPSTPQPEVEVAAATRKTPKAPKPKPEKAPDLFEEFWAIVWYKVDKKAAKTAWAKIVKDEAMGRRLIALAIQQGPILKAQADGKRNPLYPSTWLNGERYEDELLLPGFDPPPDPAEEAATQKRILNAINRDRAKQGLPPQESL